MAQTVYIDPDAIGTPDGTSWTDAWLTQAAAIADLPDPFIEDVTFECRASSGTKDTTAVTISGLNTSTHTLTIHGFDGTYILSLVQGDFWNLTRDGVNTTNVTIDGILFEKSSVTANYATILNITDFRNGTVEVKNSYFNGGDSGTTYRGRPFITIFDVTHSGVFSFHDNIVYNVPAAPSVASAHFHVFVGTLNAANIYNNTFIGGYNLLYNNAGDFANWVLVNNIFTCSNAVGETVSGSSDYNSTTLGTATGGGNDRVSQTFSFVGGDDYHLVVGDTGAIGHGIGPSADANVAVTDIDGDARSGATADIGADEFVAAGAGNPWYQYMQEKLAAGM